MDSAMPQQRRHFLKRAKTFEEYLAEEALRFKEAAEALPQGTARELLSARNKQFRSLL
jgi:hypothetical protein